LKNKTYKSGVSYENYFNQQLIKLAKERNSEFPVEVFLGELVPEHPRFMLWRGSWKVESRNWHTRFHCGRAGKEWKKKIF